MTITFAPSCGERNRQSKLTQARVQFIRDWFRDGWDHVEGARIAGLFGVKGRAWT